MHIPQETNDWRTEIPGSGNTELYRPGGGSVGPGELDASLGAARDEVCEADAVLLQLVVVARVHRLRYQSR